MMWLGWAFTMGACFCVAYVVGVTFERRRMTRALKQARYFEDAPGERMRELARELEALRPDLSARINAAVPKRRPGDRPS